MRKVGILVALILLVAACSAPAAPDAKQVSQLVEQAVRATMAAQPSPTSVAQTTPLPTASPLGPTAAPATAASAKATAAPSPVPTMAPPPTKPPAPSPTPAPTAAPSIVADKVVNLRAGPGTTHPVVGATKPGETYAIRSKTGDGMWLEICCVDQHPAWVAASVVTTAGNLTAVEIAKNLPTPPPSPTPVPVPPTAPPAPPAPAAGLHTRQRIGTWEIQAERVQNEKAVYQYDSSKVAMGRYAIVFVLAKNMASGTQDIASSLSPRLRDDKGRIYDYSNPLTTERWAMVYATWEFSVGKTVFNDVNPGVETPLLMLWDVNEDVQSLTLILTDGANKVEWDLGNFSNIPPYKPGH